MSSKLFQSLLMFAAVISLNARSAELTRPSIVESPSIKFVEREIYVFSSRRYDPKIVIPPTADLNHDHPGYKYLELACIDMLLSRAKGNLERYLSFLEGKDFEEFQEQIRTNRQEILDGWKSLYQGRKFRISYRLDISRKTLFEVEFLDVKSGKVVYKEAVVFHRYFKKFLPKDNSLVFQYRDLSADEKVVTIEAE